ncbi:hypothetical protein JVU11DRAFT_9682 [Chiua virens]|nr:hypothetical protein JVU11DRAFT_9682 [Chiua virens]
MDEMLELEASALNSGDWTDLDDLMDRDEELEAAGRLNDEGGEEMDNEAGWHDEAALLDGDERRKLHDNVAPVKLVLAKIRKLAFKIICSMTVLLLAWKQILQDLKVPAMLLPHDVVT